jgi:hypothetical protein
VSLVWLLALPPVFTGCRTTASTPTITPKPIAPTTVGVATPAAMLVRTELYFGLARPAGEPEVSVAEFQSFIDTEITPRFPDGLTVLSASGQWRGPDGRLVREPSRVLVLFHDGSAGANANVEAIRAVYCRSFHQDAVLRADSRAMVRF